ncbi:MAG: Hsp20/alpha crystallin family protein, partial [Bacteroidetes bacterium]|nr:Hsp20/alpha crystallin family protein [Bacteroidota bacterium]
MTLIKLNRPHVGQYATPTMVDFFDNFFKSDLWNEGSAGFMPAVNVAETTEAFEMELSAPGFSKEDIKIEMEKNMLTISGEHKAEEAKTEKNYTRKEFSYGAFK